MNRPYRKLQASEGKCVITGDTGACIEFQGEDGQKVVLAEALIIFLAEHIFGMSTKNQTQIQFFKNKVAELEGKIGQLQRSQLTELKVVADQFASVLQSPYIGFTNEQVKQHFGGVGVLPDTYNIVVGGEPEGQVTYPTEEELLEELSKTEEVKAEKVEKKSKGRPRKNQAANDASKVEEETPSGEAETPSGEEDATVAEAGQLEKEATTVPDSDMSPDLRKLIGD